MQFWLRMVPGALLMVRLSKASVALRAAVAQKLDAKVTTMTMSGEDITDNRVDIELTRLER